MPNIGTETRKALMEEVRGIIESHVGYDPSNLIRLISIKTGLSIKTAREYYSLIKEGCNE